MGKKPSLCREKRAQILILSNLKFSERQIVMKMKVNKTAGHNAIMKYQNEGNFQGEKRSGHPRFSCRRKDSLIREKVSLSPIGCSKKFRQSPWKLAQ